MSNLPQSKRFSNRQDAVKTVNDLYDVYDFAEFIVGTGITDYDVKTNQSNLFKNCPAASLVVIEYDKNINVKFNSTSMPSISCGYETSPREWRDILKVTNLFITNNSGGSATIKVILV